MAKTANTTIAATMANVLFDDIECAIFAIRSAVRSLSIAMD
jgi:hypothetical protein